MTATNASEVLEKLHELIHVYGVYAKTGEGIIDFPRERSSCAVTGIAIGLVSATVQRSDVSYRSGLMRT